MIFLTFKWHDANWSKFSVSMLKAKGRPFKSLLANFSELKNASHPNVTIATKEVEEENSWNQNIFRWKLKKEKNSWKHLCNQNSYDLGQFWEIPNPHLNCNERKILPIFLDGVWSMDSLILQCFKIRSLLDNECTVGCVSKWDIFNYYIENSYLSRI